MISYKGKHKPRYEVGPIIISGRNACRSAVNSGLAERLYYSTRLKDDDEVVALARERGISSRPCDEAGLSRLAGKSPHQGLVCQVRPRAPMTLKELIADSKKSRYPTLLLLDGIEDPHNLGAILRSADAFGIDGVVMRRHGQVPINPTVYRTSAGAACYVKAAEVSSLSNAIRELKDAGFWIVATDGEAKQEYYDVDYRLPVAIVVGSEGKGVSRLVLENSDFVVKIPMHGHVNSLNASVAAGIFLAQVDALRYKE